MSTHRIGKFYRQVFQRFKLKDNLNLNKDKLIKLFEM